MKESEKIGPLSIDQVLDFYSELVLKYFLLKVKDNNIFTK